MKILEQALNKINSIHKKQKDFFQILIHGLIGIAGKRTFRNLARYMNLEEHTFSRHMKKAFDFVCLNTELIKLSKEENDIFIAAQDSTFSAKSGKGTDGLGYFWNGSAGRIEKGLEFDTIAAIKVGEKNTGYAISAEQTQVNARSKSETKEEKTTKTKIFFYLEHVKKALSKLLELGIKYMVADAFYAKKTYVSGIINLGLHVISKLRKDARFRKIYAGPQKARGRRKKYESGKIKDEDFQDLKIIEKGDDKIEITSLVVYSLSLQREIKVVRICKQIENKKSEYMLLFSTDLNQSAEQIHKFYTSRFQIEFIFREAKNFTGLQDCQSRDSKRLNYHFNASLTALNVAKIQDLQFQQMHQLNIPFSMANWSRKYHVEIIINYIFSMFGFDQTLIKSHPNYEKLIAFGNVMH